MIHKISFFHVIDGLSITVVKTVQLTGSSGLENIQ